MWPTSFTGLVMSELIVSGRKPWAMAARETSMPMLGLAAPMSITMPLSLASRTSVRTFPLPSRMLFSALWNTWVITSPGSMYSNTLAIGIGTRATCTIMNVSVMSATFLARSRAGMTLSVPLIVWSSRILTPSSTLGWSLMHAAVSSTCAYRRSISSPAVSWGST